MILELGTKTEDLLPSLWCDFRLSLFPDFSASQSLLLTILVIHFWIAIQLQQKEGGFILSTCSRP